MNRPYLCQVELLDGEEDTYPFKDQEIVLNLGEIEGMPGHVAVVLQNGRTVFGYHAYHFRKLDEDEI